jgi:hypothetical protein
MATYCSKCGTVLSLEQSCDQCIQSNAVNTGTDVNVAASVQAARWTTTCETLYGSHKTAVAVSVLGMLVFAVGAGAWYHHVAGVNAIRQTSNPAAVRAGASQAPPLFCPRHPPGPRLFHRLHQSQKRRPSQPRSEYSRPILTMKAPLWLRRPPRTKWRVKPGSVRRSANRRWSRFSAGRSRRSLLPRQPVSTGPTPTMPWKLKAPGRAAERRWPRQESTMQVCSLRFRTWEMKPGFRRRVSCMYAKATSISSSTRVLTGIQGT